MKFSFKLFFMFVFLSIITFTIVVDNIYVHKEDHNYLVDNYCSHTYDNDYDNTCNSCGNVRQVEAIFKVEALYDGTTSTTPKEYSYMYNEDNIYEMKVEFVKCWGYVRFYYMGSLLTTDNITFVNVGTYNEVAYTTGLYVDSNESAYVKGQLNFSYNAATKYKFSFDAVKRTLTVKCLNCNHSYDNNYDPVCNDCDEEREVADIFEVVTLYDGTTSTSSKKTSYKYNESGLYETSVEFVKQWGYIRFYYMGQLLTTNNVTFVNVGTYNEVAYTTGLYIDSNESAYVKGQLNFSYNKPTKYKFIYDADSNTITVFCLACAHEYNNNCDNDCNLCGENRTVSDHIYSNQYDESCNECGYYREVANLFRVDTLYDKTTNANIVTHLFNSSSDGIYEIEVEFVKQWGFVRFFYKGELVSTNNTDFINVKSYNDAAYTTSLFIDSNESTYVNGQLNFSFDCPIKYKFIYNSNNSTLTVEVLGCNHTYDNACDKYCNKCNEIRTVGNHIYDNNCDTTCNICNDIRIVNNHIYDNEYDGICNECLHERDTLPVFKVESLYNGTTSTNICTNQYYYSDSDIYYSNVTFVKQWGYVRFYYMGQLLTTDNITFVNVGSWNEAAYTTKLYVDSNESAYVKGQLNFSYNQATSYTFKYDNNIKKLYVYFSTDVEATPGEFKVVSLYNGNQSSNLLVESVNKNIAGNYIVNVEFMKQWGYVRFYYNDQLLTKYNTEFVNIGTWNEAAYTTMLYIDSNDPNYVDGQLNFSYSVATSYIFEYNPSHDQLVVTCVDDYNENAKIDTTEYDNLKNIRLSSFYFQLDGKLSYKLKLEAFNTDVYTIVTDAYTTLILFDENGDMISYIKPDEIVSLHVNEESILYAICYVSHSSKPINIKVYLTEYESYLPYNPLDFSVNPNELLQTDKSGYYALDAANINYTKREGGMYINCNNPEKLTESCLNNALTRNDVSNEEVFFTFEHNNTISGSFYYGYQVINRGNEDIFVTVKNIGYQPNGAGSWMGEKEWIDFYNVNFRIKGLNNYTSAQRNTFNTYFGFSNSYNRPLNNPITYRIPAGKYIYVIGGTTADSYGNINVFNTANIAVNGGCTNGAVLFEVSGDNAEGAFYVYRDYNQVGTLNKTHRGYTTGVYGQQYVGYDNCHGVIDGHLTFEFNDNMSEYLPVTFNNYYKKNVSQNGQALGYIESTKNLAYTWTWHTNINPQTVNTAVGTDMTAYNTIYNGQNISIDTNHYDGLGKIPNLGNWMIDYMEYYTLVNHGYNEREVTVQMINNGSIAVLVRDENGRVIRGTEQYTIQFSATSSGAEINDNFRYTVKVPAKGYVQFIVEYNLLANSYGSIGHNVYLN